MGGRKKPARTAQRREARREGQPQPSGRASDHMRGPKDVHAMRNGEQRLRRGSL